MVESIDEGYVSAWFPTGIASRMAMTFQRKFGQWGPFMDKESLGRLIKQARQKGNDL
jgi:hypothetical protein